MATHKLSYYQRTGRKIGRPASPLITGHGSVARYKHGIAPCRCEECREAWRLYQAAYRARTRGVKC
jgi:hypothetical protein